MQGLGADENNNRVSLEAKLNIRRIDSGQVEPSAPLAEGEGESSASSAESELMKDPGWITSGLLCVCG